MLITSVYCVCVTLSEPKWAWRQRDYVFVLFACSHLL